MGTHDVLPLDVGIVMEKNTVICSQITSIVMEWYTAICSHACSHLNKWLQARLQAWLWIAVYHVIAMMFYH